MSDQEIKEICDKHNMRNYTINNGYVDVDGDVSLAGRKLTEYPVRFGTVTGDFASNDNKLTSLEFSPEYVGNDFFCSDNYLIDNYCDTEIVGKCCGSCLRNRRLNKCGFASSRHSPRNWH